jgi:hypothetical protein
MGASPGMQPRNQQSRNSGGVQGTHGPLPFLKGLLDMKRILLCVFVITAIFAPVCIATSGRAVEAASSNYLDNLHAKANIVCAGCHGKDLPKAGDTVESARCLECHGPMDQLAKKTKPKDLKDHNPHESHLENAACTICHKGHTESKVYCLECHKEFDMKIKGASQAKQ